ncbi:hypothetical protein TRSC58_04434 [Trypanosoma rangeli SC58]|uniref:EF-hand domain-containing protein n=1 Tax=Trypanosoma rangeli SC58 TaxID=429131 RepID=A0A061IXJ5_TRYRA|nr:hypothetical protein TRSC58_04434 [Trypanosoma rangeli SC58]
MAKTKKKAEKGNSEVHCITVGAKQLLVSVQDKLRRQKHAKFFDELLEATEETTRGPQTLTTLGMSEVPVLAVGYIARAMGLNLSNEDVLCLLEMVEETDAASRGVVPAKALKEVIVEALMTGLMAPPRAALPATTSRKQRPTAPPTSRIMPISVVRDSEEAIYQAFSVLDLARRGYLEAEEMRHFLRSGGEPFTEEEVEQFIAAAADPESGRIYYEEFADVLATE